MSSEACVQLRQAIQAYRQGEYVRARDLCAEVLRHNLPPEGRVVAHVYRGYALGHLGDHEGASMEYRRALDLNPSAGWHSHLHYVLGIALRERGEDEAARIEFQHVIEYVGDIPTEADREQAASALCELGILEYRRSNYTGALACVERASGMSLSGDPKNAIILLTIEKVRGQALFWLKRWDESIPHFRSALAIVPEPDTSLRALLMCYLGLSLCAIREHSEALAALQNAHVEEDDEPGLWAAMQVWLGNLYYQRNDFAKALEHYERLVNRPAEDWASSRESLARMADCYCEAGKHGQALAVAEKAYRELRGNDLVHLEYAKALANVDRADEARRVLEELDENAIDPGLRERFLAHSAYVAIRLRDRTRAKDLIDKLRALNPFSRYLHPLKGALPRGWFQRGSRFR